VQTRSNTTSVRIFAASVVLLTAACGGGGTDAPAKPVEPIVTVRTAQVGVTVSSGATGTADIAVGFERSGAFTELARQSAPQDTAGRRLSIAVDLTACSGSTGVARCDVVAIVRLLDTRGARTDSVKSGPVSVTGGATVDVPLIRLRPVARLVAVDSMLRVNTGARASVRVNALDASGEVLTDRTLTWRSLNSAIVTVDVAGQVTGVSPGQTTVEASRDPLVASVTIVVPVVESFVLNTPTLRLPTGNAGQMNVSITVAAGRSRRVLYRSDNPAVATIDTTGRVQAIARGVATMTAVAEVDTTARVTLAVTVDALQAASAWRFVQIPDNGQLPGNPAGIWGPSSDSLVMAGDFGIARYDGTVWRFDRAVGFAPLAITGNSLREMWVVGTQISRFDGNVWARETVTQNGTLRAATSAAGVTFAVGDNGQILRRDANGWRAMASGTTSALRAVSAWDANTVYAAGDGATVLRLSGDAWVPVNTGRTGDIYALLVRSPTEVYAAGFDATSSFILRFDGTQWTTMTRDANVRVYGFITAGSTVLAYGDETAVLRLDAQRWVLDKPLTRGLGLRAGWGDARSSVVAGFSGVSLARRSGQWVPLTFGPSYIGLWAASGSFIVGGGTRGGIDVFDGTRWSTMRGDGGNETRADGGNEIRGIWGSSERDIWAVGRDTLLLRYQGTSWERVPVNTGGSLWGIWGASRDTVFSVVDNGEILRFDGTTWRTVFRSPGALRAVHGVNGRAVYAVGDQGRIWRYDGRIWTQEESGTTDQITGVYAADTANAFAVTATQFLQRVNGNWRATSTPANLTLTWVTGSSANDVYAGGSARVHRFDGTSWSVFDPNNVVGITLSGIVIPGGGMVLGQFYRRIFSGTGPLGNTPGVPR
jgi:hypothetical protein